MINQVQSGQSLVSYQNKVISDNGSDSLESERQIIFDFTRQLTRAQFYLADEELTRRLWKEVGRLNLDLDRIINLMYGCVFHDDDQAMIETDLYYLSFNLKD